MKSNTAFQTKTLKCLKRFEMITPNQVYNMKTEHSEEKLKWINSLKVVISHFREKDTSMLYLRLSLKQLCCIYRSRSRKKS